jgi:hypothetical protein
MLTKPPAAARVEQRAADLRALSPERRLGRRRRGTQHTSAYISIRQHASAYVRLRQHTSAT